MNVLLEYLNINVRRFCIGTVKYKFTSILSINQYNYHGSASKFLGLSGKCQIFCNAHIGREIIQLHHDNYSED